MRQTTIYPLFLRWHRPWMLYPHEWINPHWECQLQCYKFDKLRRSLNDSERKRLKGLILKQSDLDRVLNRADPIEQHHNYMELGMGTFRLKSEQVLFQRAFIACADILKDVQIDRPPRSECQAGYIANSTGENIPIVFDTGCSFSLTPFHNDFTGPLSKTQIEEMKGLTKDTVKVEGMGWV